MKLTELDEFLEFLYDHIPEVISDCEFGPHYYCSCTVQNFYSYSDWLYFHKDRFRNEKQSNQ